MDSAGRITARERARTTRESLQPAAPQGASDRMTTKVLIVDSTLHLGRPLLSFSPPAAGFDVSVFDDAPFVAPLQNRPAHKVLYRMLGRRPVSAWMLNRRLYEHAAEYRPDIVIVA